MNVYRLQDDVMTDTIFSDTPAIDDSYTQAQVFFVKHHTLSTLNHCQRQRTSCAHSKTSFKNGEHQNVCLLILPDINQATEF